ncbi:phosphatidate cytidylyltransferase [Levyella massiliensis]|uniref:phosphatidate cytidylyltransferase n=1 Tax=Levyella massiliensis TaxID=938289 RepID=UPI0003740920|nr:phosphatidate cytidylyltransferase [Levyella massiliensis]
MKSFKERLLVGAIILSVTLSVILSSSRLLLFLFVLVLSSLEIVELFHCLDPSKTGRNHWIMLIGNALFQFCAYLAVPELQLAVAVLFFMYLFVLSVVHPYREFEDLFITLFVSIYISFFSSFTLNFPAVKQNYLLLILCVSWGTDTFAYLAGFFFGKTPLTEISPKKTREGAIGGLIGAILLSLLLRPFFYISLSADKVFLIALAGSIAAQVGDLFASRLKRKMNIKDFGTLLKAHGGIMDRFDSVQFALPTVWLMVRIFTKH